MVIFASLTATSFAQMPPTWTAHNDAGTRCFKEGAFVQAEKYFQAALREAEATKGALPQVAKSLNNLALVFAEETRYIEAELLLRRAVGIVEKIYGAQSPEMASVVSNLAMVYRLLGKFAQAEPLARQVVAINEKNLGPQNVGVATSLNSLALIATSLGKLAEAEGLYRRSLGILQTAQGQATPDVAATLNNLALVFDKLGNPVAAEPLARSALAIFESTQGPASTQVASTLNNLSQFAREQGRLAEAQQLLDRSMTLQKTATMAQTPPAAIATAQIPAKPVAPAAPAVPIAPVAPAAQAETAETAAATANQGALSLARGDSKSAIPLLTKALAAQEKILGPSHPDTIQTMVNLAQAHFSQGQLAQAVPLYKRAIDTWTKTGAAPKEVQVSTLESYAQVLQKMSRPIEADNARRRAAAIRGETAPQLPKLAGGGGPTLME